MSKFLQYPCYACMADDKYMLDSEELLFHHLVFQNVCKLSIVDTERILKISLQLL